MAKTLLLVDDSPTIRKVVELSFGETEFRVAGVGSGAEALAQLDRLAPDAVLADVGMAEPDGYEICRRIKSSERPVPVVLLVGAFEPFDEGRARRCGADGHVVKPFDAGALVQRIRDLLAAPPVRPEPHEPGEINEVANVAAPPLPAVGPSPTRLAPDQMEALVREVVLRLSDTVVRDLAREIVPQVAEQVVRARIRELEAENDPN